MSDMYEVEAGKIATQKGQTAPVKGFAEMMVDAHSKTPEELKGIIASEKRSTSICLYEARRQTSKTDR